ncbi:MAG TPA: ABC transporter ATP-binding protein [Solirubrobacteraceae bacterium]|jgi:ABC-type polysaccharide/polyol phosphate transport system ATPase subunit
MPTPPAIAVEGVSKHFARPHEQLHTLKERALHPFRHRSFDRFQAVRDVSFQVEQGEFFGIVGRNGSGKSTLLKLMAGIYRANAGEIWVNGRMSTFIELGVGFNPDLAARDNVILNAIMLGLTPREARERYERVIDFAELRDFADLKLKNYSSGMHVRLAFAVMIQVDADVLLIDEVLAVGDASFQQKCFDEFNRLRDEGKTIVLVTHDMGAVRRFCHRAMLLEQGSIVDVGDPDMIGSEYLEMNFDREARERPPAPAATTAPAEDETHAARDRFGDGRAVITDCWVEDERGERVTTVMQGQTLTIRSVVEFRAAMKHPSVGIRIDNEERRFLFGANSIWKEERTGEFAAGDRATFSVRFKNVFVPGRYTISPAVAARGSALELADNRIAFRSFVVNGPFVTGGVVDLDHDFAIERGALAPPAEVEVVTSS